MKNENISFAIWVKIAPNALKTECIGWEDSWLKIKIQEPPEKGRANDAVICYLASILKIHKNKLKIKTGHTSKLKCIYISSISQEDAMKAIENQIAKT